jgi:hypothetical protein
MTLLTDEQRLVLYAANSVRRLKAEALAGTGKTTVLVEVAKALKTNDPTKRILYTAFNKMVVKDVGDKIRRFADALTVHGLAMRTIGVDLVQKKMQNNPRRLRPSEAAHRLGIESSIQFKAKRLVAYDQQRDTELELTPPQQFRLVRRCLAEFARSPDKTILPKHVDEAWWSKQYQARFVLPVAVKQQIGHLAERMWDVVTLPTTSTFEFQHDYYMKMWHLTNPILPYDTILFDEAQDADPLMRDVVENHDGQVIWCGDRHQSIYSWRGAVNAMQEVEADHTLYLTQSFRFGQEIAHVANSVLRQLGGHTIKGDERIRSITGRVDRPDAELYYLNITALLRFVQLVEQGEQPTINLDLGALKGQIHAVKLLTGGTYSDHPDFEQFLDLADLVAWMTDENVEWGEFEFTVRRLIKLQRTSKKLETACDIDKAATLRWLATLTKAIELAERGRERGASGRLLSTVHRVKGLQFDSVLIGDDFPKLNSLRLGDPAELERWHVAYVALTRAKLQLEHPFAYVEALPTPGTAEHEHQQQSSKPRIQDSQTGNETAGLNNRGLLRTKEFNVRVVGTSYRQSELTMIASRFSPTDKERRLVAVLRPEANNPYDPNAVSIDIDGTSVGYLPKEFAQVVAPLLANKTFWCDALLTGGHEIPHGRAYYGLMLAVAWRL